MVEKHNSNNILSLILKLYLTFLPTTHMFDLRLQVRLLRNTERQGLIRSRVRAARAALGPVLVFLDSHCEVEQGWLEPLLDRVNRDRTTIASPVIDNINSQTFQFEPVSIALRGGFDWNLEFFWEYLPARDRSRRIRDPTR